MKLNAISEKCGINKTTTFKILSVLTEYGYVEKTQTGARYGIGTKLFNIQDTILKKTDLCSIARPFMIELEEKYNQTINLMMFIGDKGYYAEIIGAEHSKEIVENKIGDSDFLYATALGKAILSALPKEKIIEILQRETMRPLVPNTIVDMELLINELELSNKRGFAIDDEESHVGSRCVSAPILNSSKEVVGAISISGVSKSVSISTLFEFSDQIMIVAAKISEAL